MKKKVLIIASCPLSNDGLTKIIFDVISDKSRGIEFVIGSGYFIDQCYKNKLTKLGVKYYEISRKKNILAYFFAVIRLIRKEKISTVYIHGNSALMFLEAFPAKIAKTEVITHCHNTSTKHPLVHMFIKPLFNLLVDKKIGCSELASKWAYQGKRITIIPNGIDVKKFAFSAEKRDAIRKKLGVRDKLLIGHIGRFDEQKNHMKLVSIFEQLHNIDSDTRMVLIGDGKLKKTITTIVEKKQLTEEVFFVPNIDKPEDYMSAMDIMVMPSLYEGLSLVALEAQANGLVLFLDDKFAKETVISENVYIRELEATDVEWAKSILSVDSKHYIVNDKRLMNKCDVGIMLNKIYNLITD